MIPESPVDKGNHTVSVIVPCLNEEATIVDLLDAIYVQDYGRENMEVIIADGLSTDNTRAKVESFRQARPGLRIQLIDNPSRKIPSGLNAAIAASKGDYVIRLDAHSAPHPDYISRAVGDLLEGKGWNVGGIWLIQPGSEGWIAESIAEAAGHPMGVGDAFYRYARTEGAVDTVPFGAFRRRLIHEIGGFNEELEANEDYEFNARIRKAGGVVWLDPMIKSNYFARPTLKELARQYARYGYWKWQMLRNNPGTMRLRQALPPVFVASLILLVLASIAIPWPRWVLIIEVVSYVFLLFTVALKKALAKKKPMYMIGIPLAISTMHIAWGMGFLGSIFSIGKKRSHPADG
ncbi:MAG: glycosyltransferase family 2 protein [Anaerolineales bacterium]